MRNNTLLILGGYGEAGFAITRLLLQETDVQLILGGRNQEKAERTANQLNTEFSGARVQWRYANAADSNSLAAAIDGVDMLVVCSTTTQYVEQVARAALSAGIDYLDIYYPQQVISALKPLEPSILAAGRCFITQAGFHPGLLAPFVRYAASYFSQYRKAIIGMLMNVRHVGSLDSAAELVEGIGNYKAYVFKNSQWLLSSYQDRRKIDFGRDFGVRICMPLWFEEMRAMPEQYGLEETGTYVAGFNWFVDYLVSPLAMILYKFKKGLGTRLLSRLMLWGNHTFSRPPFGVRFKLEAEGEKNGKPSSLEILAQHDDVYLFTAIPTVACLLQYLDGSIRKPGLWLMGHVVEPNRLLKDMERMGVKMEVKDDNARLSIG